MRYTRFTTFLLAAALAVVGLVACDFSEQNYDIEPGDSLAIRGATEVEAGDAAEYSIHPFTIEKNYTWSVSGNAEIVDTRRGGEFIDVSFPETGTYTVEVTAAGGGDPEYSGSLDVTVVEPSEEE